MSNNRLTSPLVHLGNQLFISRKVVFLDEPTCGMDPVARRHSWTILSSFTKSGHTIILTSHRLVLHTTVHSSNICISLCNIICRCMCIYIYIYVCACVCVYARMFVCVYICLCLHTNNIVK